MNNLPGDRPSDRPDHPPVWVRGGPPYYYMPTRPSIPSSPSETLRRASTTSTLSSSPESSVGGAFSPPPSPATSPEHPSGFQSHFSFSPFSGSSPLSHQTSPPQRPPYMAQQPPDTSSTSGFGSEAQSPPRPNAFRRSNSISGTNLFSNLSSQKRNTADTSFASRRAQWHEQNVGAGPDKKRFFSSWWDK
ncbi:hypothetical protein AJ78_05167 [Emergomyces pasteurianus Ep9510]|uniref:Uncharacterized protein n=1 Tax=Emergomyces pasteurianus Ep9510 TaxID=1447872 RepID=A0A1J9Q2Q6_9EURO|nr:hypothetical protein AJ78_05167 [Emergomyces pasteurianus Ep9510]